MKATMFFILICTALSAQPLTLRGRVADLADQPAPGLRIMSAARADSVFTDDAGRFELTVDRSVVGVRGGLPQSFYLSEAFPNPGAFTTLTLSLEAPSPVSAAVYNLLGQKVRDLGEGLLPAGAHLMRWDLRDDRGMTVPRGVYLFRIVIDGRAFQSKIAALPGAPVTFASAAPRLAKTAGDLDLFISSPDRRYEDKVERLSVGAEEVLENLDIRVNRLARLIYDGPDTLRLDVGDRQSASLIIDDDEPVVLKNLSYFSRDGRVWEINPTIDDDGNVTLDFIVGEAGNDVMTFIYQSGAYSVRVDVPVQANSNVTTLRVADGVTDEPRANVPVYDENEIEIARTGTDGTADVVVNDLRNRTFYVGEIDKVSRVSIPLERLIRDDSFNTYQMGEDFPWRTFCWLTSMYADRAGKSEGDPTIRGTMRGYDPRALDENGYLLYRLVFPIDKTKQYNDILAQIARVHADFQDYTHDRFGLSLFDLVNNTATTPEENRALYDQFWDTKHPEKPKDFDGPWYKDYGVFFMAWTTQTNPGAIVPEYFPISWTEAIFDYLGSSGGSTFEELFTSSAGLTKETKDPRFKGTPFEGKGKNEDVRLPYQGEDIQAKQMIFSPSYYHGMASPGTHVYAVPQGPEKVMVVVSNYGPLLPMTNQVQRAPM